MKKESGQRDIWHPRLRIRIPKPMTSEEVFRRLRVDSISREEALKAIPIKLLVCFLSLSSDACGVFNGIIVFQGRPCYFVVI